MRRTLVFVSVLSLLVAGCDASTVDLTLDSNTTIASIGSTSSSTTSTPSGSASTTSTPSSTSTSIPSTTTTIGAEAASTTSTWVEPYAGDGVILRSDGVGPATFGDPVDEVMVQLSAVLGEPDSDVLNEYPEPIGIYSGVAADFYIRLVFWGRVGLSIVLSDGYAWSDGLDDPVLIRWFHSLQSAEHALVTSEGIGVGATIAELSAAYADLLTFREDEFDGWQASLPEVIPGVSPTLQGLVFGLTGDPANPDTTVGYMWAGAAVAP